MQKSIKIEMLARAQIGKNKSNKIQLLKKEKSLQFDLFRVFVLLQICRFAFV